MKLLILGYPKHGKHTASKLISAKLGIKYSPLDRQMAQYYNTNGFCEFLLKHSDIITQIIYKDEFENIKHWVDSIIWIHRNGVSSNIDEIDKYELKSHNANIFINNSGSKIQLNNLLNKIDFNKKYH